MIVSSDNSVEFFGGYSSDQVHRTSRARNKPSNIWGRISLMNSDVELTTENLSSFGFAHAKAFALPYCNSVLLSVSFLSRLEL